MAPVANHLTGSEFDRLYGHEAGWEYWFGEARRKPVPTFLHGLLQVLLADLLRLAGYIATVESDLHSDPDWRPRPDVYGVLQEIQGKYATKPVDVVFEVLSDDEDVVTKCQHYTQIGIPQVFVFSPEAKTIARWDGQVLMPILNVELANGVTITGETIWSSLEKRRRVERPASKFI